MPLADIIATRRRIDAFLLIHPTGCASVAQSGIKREV